MSNKFDENEKEVYILTCEKCGRMYKAIRKEANVFTTDFGDKLENCFCGEELKHFKTLEWVAEKLFTIKGER